MPRALPYDLVSCSISIASIVIAQRGSYSASSSGAGTITTGHRAVLGEMLTHGTEQQTGESAAATGSDDEHRGASVEVEQAQGRSTVEHLDGDVQSLTVRAQHLLDLRLGGLQGHLLEVLTREGRLVRNPRQRREIPTRHHVQADVLPTGRIGAPPQRGCRRLGAVDPHDHAPVCVRLRAHRPAAFAPRCSANQLLARVATVSSAPGSSKRCVAPGTTTTSCSQRIIVAAS